MPFKKIFKYFCLWQVAIIAIVALSANFLKLRPTFIGGGEQASFYNPVPYIKNPELYFRGNFDGVHYIGISRRGYGLDQQAFFPLYPKIMSAVYPLTKNSVFNGSLISSLFFLAGLYVFAKLIRLDYSNNTAFWTISVLLIYPVSFFFTSVYTEGLFFFLCISSFYFARKKRWLLAGILVILATYARFVGILLVPALASEMYSQKAFLKKWLIVALMPLGLITYMIFLNKTTGDPLKFIHVQKNFGQGRSDKIIMLYQVYYRYGKMLLTVNRADPLYATLVLEAGTGVAFFALSLISLFKMRPSYALFNIGSFLLPTFTGTFTSLPRYVLLCFPSFILIGSFLSTSPKWLKTTYLVISGLLGFVFLSLFARGYWVS